MSGPPDIDTNNDQSQPRPTLIAYHPSKLARASTSSDNAEGVAQG
jgi:hypothetical protein